MLNYSSWGSSLEDSHAFLANRTLLPDAFCNADQNLGANVVVVAAAAASLGGSVMMMLCFFDKTGAEICEAGCGAKSINSFSASRLSG